MTDDAPSSPSPDNSVLDALLGFVGPLAVDRAYKNSSWNVGRYVKRLVQIIDDENTPARVVLATAEILRLHGLSVLQISGQHPPGAPHLLSGTVAAEVLPAADLARLEDGAARTQSMLEGEMGNEDSQAAKDRVEDAADGGDDQITEGQGVCPEGEDPESREPGSSGGTEAGAGQGSTEDVLGHRPPAGARRGLCGAQPAGG